MTQATLPAPMTPDDEVWIGAQLFDFVHAVEHRFGLAGVRVVKRWCVEKLPYKAFPKGYFGEGKP